MDYRTRRRLTALQGDNRDTDRLIQDARSKLAMHRTLEIKNLPSAEGSAEFWVLLVPGPKVTAVKFISGDETLRPFTANIEAAAFPNPFPDTAEVKLLRRGKLTCSRSSESCSLLLASAETVRFTN